MRTTHTSQRITPLILLETAVDGPHFPVALASDLGGLLALICVPWEFRNI